MALVMSPWFGRGGCGRRGNSMRPFFSFGSPSLFSDLVIVKVPVMQQKRQAAATACVPAMSNARVVQWAETSEGHTFKLRLPGLKKEDLQIQVEDDGTLYIKYSNEPKDAAKQQGDAGTSISSGTCSFMRKFKLPETADLEQIKAEVTNETLTVLVPKLKKKVHASQEPRPIHIAGVAAAAASSQQQPGKAAEISEAEASTSTA